MADYYAVPKGGFTHSKGKWKKHKYIRKEGNRYIYPEDLTKKNDPYAELARQGAQERMIAERRKYNSIDKPRADRKRAAEAHRRRDEANRKKALTDNKKAMSNLAGQGAQERRIAKNRKYNNIEKPKAERERRERERNKRIAQFKKNARKLPNPNDVHPTLDTAYPTHGNGIKNSKSYKNKKRESKADKAVRQYIGKYIKSRLTRPGMPPITAKNLLNPKSYTLKKGRKWIKEIRGNTSFSKKRRKR